MKTTTDSKRHCLAEVVTEFDRTGGDEQEIRRLVRDWPDKATVWELHRALWGVRLERLRDEDDACDALRRAIEGLPRVEARKLCRQFYHVACGQRRPVDWSTFADNNFTWEELKLTFRGSAVCLGSELNNRFRVDALKSAGEFGVVYSASDLTTGATVAVKSSCGLSAEERRQSSSLIHLEARCLRMVGGFGLPAYVDMVCLEDGGCAIVMEYVDGETLADIIATGMIGAELACSLCADVADIVDLLHRCDIYHRDLKPENIIVTEEGKVYLLDLGLALTDDERYLQDGAMVGTLSHMAPESITGSVSLLDHRADIWSLGVIFYELVAGLPVAFRTSPPELLREAILRERYDWIDESVPAPLRKVINRCITIEPALRYDRAKDFADDLRRFLGQQVKPSDLDGAILITAWGIGAAFARCKQACAKIARELAHGSLELDGPSVGGNEVCVTRAFDAGRTLVFCIGELIAYAERIALGGAIPNLVIQDELLAVCRNEDYCNEKGRWLRSQMPGIKEHLDLLDWLLSRRLAGEGERALACFELAVGSMLHGGNVALQGALDGLWRKARLPERPWTEFKDAMAKGADRTRAWLEWNRSVERALLFPVEDFLDHPVFNPFCD